MTTERTQPCAAARTEGGAQPTKNINQPTNHGYLIIIIIITIIVSTTLASKIKIKGVSTFRSVNDPDCIRICMSLRRRFYWVRAAFCQNTKTKRYIHYYPSNRGFVRLLCPSCRPRATLAVPPPAALRPKAHTQCQCFLEGRNIEPRAIRIPISSLSLSLDFFSTGEHTLPTTVVLRICPFGRAVFVFRPRCTIEEPCTRRH